MKKVDSVDKEDEDKKQIDDNKLHNKRKLSFLKGSLQNNTQDLDQEQKVEVSPEQYNSQNVYVFSERQTMFSGLYGTAFFEKNREIASNVNLMLFFGTESRCPIMKLSTDAFGTYEIKELPPGYYSIYAELKDVFKYRSHFIKLLPGERIEHNLLLR